MKVYCHSKKKVLSVMALEGHMKGRVVAHVERLGMRDIVFEVSDAGRERVLRDHRKSVHAWLLGEIDALWGAELRLDLDNDTIKGLGIGGTFKPIDGVRVRYNPYETSSFIRADNGAPLRGASRALLERCSMLAEGVF